MVSHKTSFLLYRFTVCFGEFLPGYTTHFTKRIYLHTRCHNNIKFYKKNAFRFSHVINNDR